MVSATPISIIRARIEANWTATTIAWPNENFVPPDASPFISVDFISGSSSQVSLGSPGNNRFREVAAVAIGVFVPSNTGSDLAFTYADQLAALFRAKTFSGVRALSPRIGNGRFDDQYGKWFRVDVFCPFQYDMYA